MFEGIAKTNTTHTQAHDYLHATCLRVLLKQILPTLVGYAYDDDPGLRVLLKQILPTQYRECQ